MFQVNGTGIEMNGLSPGTKYQIRVRAETSAGFGPFSEAYTTSTNARSIESSAPEKLVNQASSVSILLSVGAAILVISLLISLAYYYKKEGKMLFHGSKRQRRETKRTANPQISLHHEELQNERLIGR